MKIGFALPHYDFSSPGGEPATLAGVVEWATKAEELGFDSVWISDHFFLDLTRYGGPAQRFGTPEALATLSAIAAETERVRLGTLVLCYAFRHAATLAKEAATLDAASDGRLDLGIGAGWYEDEFRAMGIPFPGTGDRVSALREYVAVVGGMLSDPAFSFRGRFVSVEGATNIPPPVQKPRPPIWIGSKGGERMLRTIARHADGWNTVWRWTPEAYAAVAARLNRACEETGRDPTTVRRSVGLLCLLGENENDLEQRWRALQRWSPGGALDSTSLDEFRLDTLVGTPAECAEQVRAFADLGVEQVILSFGGLPFALFDESQLALGAELIRDVAWK